MCQETVSPDGVAVASNYASKKCLFTVKPPKKPSKPYHPTVNSGMPAVTFASRSGQPGTLGSGKPGALASWNKLTSLGGPKKKKGIVDCTYTGNLLQG